MLGFGIYNQAQSWGLAFAFRARIKGVRRVSGAGCWLRRLGVWGLWCRVFFTGFVKRPGLRWVEIHLLLGFY